jgi:hypothetical protein
MSLMSFSEYARHRGVSRMAVTYAVRDGRISTTTDHAGKRCIESEVADAEWAKNTAHDKRRNTGEVEAGLSAPAVSPIPSGGHDPAPSQSFANQPSIKAPQVQIGFDPRALLIPEKPQPGAGGDSDETSYAKSRAYKEHYLAKQAEQDFLLKAGNLVPVEDVKKQWTQVATIVRTKVLGIPSKAKQRIQDLTSEQYMVLEDLVREVLEDLSSAPEERSEAV